jgi:hypothetical protein
MEYVNIEKLLLIVYLSFILLLLSLLFYSYCVGFIDLFIFQRNFERERSDTMKEPEATARCRPSDQKERARRPPQREGEGIRP